MSLFVIPHLYITKGIPLTKSTQDLRHLSRESLSHILREHQISCFLQKTSQGSPYLIHNDQKIFTSLTHTPGLFVWAFADQPIGVDTESLKRPITHISHKILDANEKLYYQSLPSSEQSFYLHETWGAKEAYGKYLGTGLLSPQSSPFLEPQQIHKRSFPSVPQFISLKSTEPTSSVFLTRIEVETYLVTICLGKKLCVNINTATFF